MAGGGAPAVRDELRLDRGLPRDVDEGVRRHPPRHVLRGEGSAWSVRGSSERVSESQSGWATE
jgi:hypothetical protein